MRGWEASVKFPRRSSFFSNHRSKTDWVNSLAGFNRPHKNVAEASMRVNLNVSRSKDGIIITSIIAEIFLIADDRSDVRLKKKKKKRRISRLFFWKYSIQPEFNWKFFDNQSSSVTFWISTLWRLIFFFYYELFTYYESDKIPLRWRLRIN